jgi:starch phosphorylase
VISHEEVWQAHQQARQILSDTVKGLCGYSLHADLPILGFARRMTAYKRPDLLFSDIERLKAIAAEHPFQLVMAGKAHPADNEGKQLIAELYYFMRELTDQIPMVYLPDYDMALAGKLVSGCDVWLNTPLPPLEASGTSGMKAAFNGVPSLSALDGWWLEGCIEGVTGWAVGSGSVPVDRADADSLYDKLQHMVLPLYYDDRAGWINMMKSVISINASFFNSHRMMRRYVTESYST